MKIGFRDVLFWALMLFALGLLIWKLFGSPELEVLLGPILAAFGLIWREIGTIKGDVGEAKGRLARIEKLLNAKR